MNLWELAKHGVVSTADANGIGIGPYELAQLCKAGRLWRPVRGMYAVWPPDQPMPPWEGEQPWEAESNKHRLLITALLRSFDSRVIASHQSALVLARARLYRLDLSVAHVTRVKDDHSRHRAHAVIHPRLDVEPVETPEGLLMVPPAIAAVQVGLVAQGDRRPDPLPSLVAADGLLHAAVITRAELDEAIAMFDSHPGISAVRQLLAHASQDHESVGETCTSCSLRALGYEFETQARPRRDGRQRADFRLKGENVLIEYDGLGKYSNNQPPTPEVVRAALSSEKRREDDIRLDGWQFVRIQPDEVHSLAVIRHKVEKARTLARLTRGAGPDGRGGRRVG